MIKNSFLAGILIGIGGLVNLTVGGVIGALGFSLGLIIICTLNKKLYTGKAGTDINLKHLSVILGCNILGCIALGLITWNSTAVPGINLVGILENRANAGVIEALGKSMLCGVIMDCIVAAWKEKGSYIPILLGVPGFILCGLYHSIADSYYYTLGLLGGLVDFPNIWMTWILSIIGNYVGCNFRKILSYDTGD